MPTARIASATGPIELCYEETSVTRTSRASSPANQHVAELLAAVESGRWGTWKRAGR